MWKLVTDGDIATPDRDKLKIVDGGDYIPGSTTSPGYTYQLADLGLAPGGSATFFIEGLKVGTHHIHTRLDALYGDLAMQATDEVIVSVHGIVDVDVDSDNANGLERSLPEDGIEDVLAGRYIPLNNNDLDFDGVPDYADPQITHLDAAFEPIEIDLPTLDDDAQVELTYSASNPDQIANDPETGWPLPAPGRLRLWTKNAAELRNPNAFNDPLNPGHYVPPGVYTYAQVVDVLDVLYAEGANLSGTLGDGAVTVKAVIDSQAQIEVTDVANMTVVALDVDVDSDNNQLLGAMERDLKEEIVEYLQGDWKNPGKWVVSNVRDRDGDGISDVVDGFDANGILGDEDDLLDFPAATFTPLVIEVPEPVDPSEALVRLTYDASDPSALLLQNGIYSPAGGSLRIWTVDAYNGGFPRNAAPANAAGGAGHYVPSGVYTLEQLGATTDAAGNLSRTVTLFVEGVDSALAPPNLQGQVHVAVELDPDGCPEDHSPGSSGVCEPDSASVTPATNADFLHVDDVWVQVVHQISVKATDAIAQETGAAENDKGIFTFSRGEGNTSGNVTVYYEVVTDQLLPNVLVADPHGNDYNEQLFDFNDDEGRLIGMIDIPNGQSLATLEFSPNDLEGVEWDEAVQIRIVEHHEYRKLFLDSSGNPSTPYYAYTESSVRVAHDDEKLQAISKILDDDEIAVDQNRNLDAKSTGLTRSTIGNGVIELSLQNGQVTLPVSSSSPFAANYYADDNLLPIEIVEMKLPEIPDQVSARLIYGGVSNGAPLIQYDLVGMSISPGDTLRFQVPGSETISTQLASGHNDFTVVFDAVLADGSPVTRTVRGATETVNRVNPAVGDTEFGARWSIDFVDDLRPGDGITPHGNSPGNAISDLAPMGARADVGVALIRGDNTSAWYDANIKSIGAQRDDSELSAADKDQWSEEPSNKAENGAYLMSTAGMRGLDKSLTYAFPVPTDRVFQVFTTWDPSPSRATNVQYTVSGKPVGESAAAKSITVDQTYTPGEVMLRGHRVRSLGFYTAVGGSLTVTIGTGGADGEVVADSVYLVDDWEFVTPVGSYNSLDYESIEDTTYYVDPNYDPSPGTFTFADKYGSRTEFDARGLKQVVVDRNGNRTELTYDANEKLKTITEQGGLTTSVNGSSVTDFGGRTTSWGGGISLPDTGAFAVGFGGPGGRLNSVTDPNGHITQLEYDPITRHVNKVINPDGHEWRLEPILLDGLDVAGLTGTVFAPPANNIGALDQLSAPELIEPRATYTDPRGNDWTYQTDHFGLVTAKSQPATDEVGSQEDVWLWQRNEHGLVGSHVQPAGGGGNTPLPALTTTYGYDKGTVSMVGYPNGATLAMVFDSQFNQLVSRTNQAGNLTTYGLDSRGNAELRTEHNASGPDRKTHYTYTSPPTAVSGMPAVSAMPGGLVEEEIAAYLSDDAVTTETIYHTTGLQIGLPHWIKIAKGTDVEGTITRTYDANRNLVQSIDVFGAVTVYLFDGMNRLKTQTLPDPGTGQHAAPVLTNLYDAAGNRRAVIDPRSGRTDYQHHWRGGISNKLLPDVGDGRHETAYHYDPNGNLEREEDKSLTRETTHTYNERNQRVKTLEPLPQDPNANHGRPEYIFKVDTLGNVKAARDPRLNWTYTSYDALSRPFQVQLPATSQHTAPTTTRIYDGLGRVVQVSEPGLSGGIAQTNHVYDSLGRRVSTTLPADSNGRRATSKYDYDLRDNLVEVTNAKGQRAVFDYDERNRQTDAGSPGADAATIKQIYDDATRTIETVVSSGDPATERRSSESFDQLGRVIVSTGVDPDGTGPQLATLATYAYDASSNPKTQILADHGNVETYQTDRTHNLLGFQTMVEGPTVDGQRPTKTWGYDIGLRMDQAATLVSPAVWATSNFAHDALDRVVSTLLPANSSGTRPEYTQQYDVGSLMVAAADPLNRVVQWVSDALGRVTSTIEPSTANHGSPTTAAVYGQAGNQLSATEGAGTGFARTISTLMDNLENVLQTTFPAVGGVTPVATATYDILGNMMTSTDVEGNTSHFVYDNLNRLVQMAAPREDESVPADIQIADGGALAGPWVGDTSAGHNGDHSYVDNNTAATAEWRFTVPQGTSYLVMTTWELWDENVQDAVYSVFDGPNLEDDLLVNQTVAPADRFAVGRDWHTLGIFTVSAAGADNLRVKLTGNADGRVVADAVRIVEVGPTTTREYNAFGDMISETDPLDNTTYYFYDFAGRQTKVVFPDPDGPGPATAPEITRSYDTFGNLLSETDPLGNTTSHTYDALFRRVSTTDANLDTTFFDYDLRGNLTYVLDPAGNETVFQYDLLGQLLSETVTLDGVTESRTYGYDLAGNLLREVDRNGRVTDYAYDALNRPVSQAWYDNVADADLGINAVNNFGWTYDVLSRVTGESDANSDYDYTYDALDRVLGVTANHFADLGPITLTNGYGRMDGLRTSLTASIDGVADFVNDYQYDDLDRLTQITQSAAGAVPVAEKRVDLGWRLDNLPDAVTRYADLAGTELVAGTTFGYDLQSRLTDITHSQGATTLADYDLVFDDASRLTQFTSLTDGVGRLWLRRSRAIADGRLRGCPLVHRRVVQL